MSGAAKIGALKGLSRVLGAAGFALSFGTGFLDQKEMDQARQMSPMESDIRAIIRGGATALAGGAGFGLGAATCAPGVVVAVACGALASYGASSLADDAVDGLFEFLDGKNEP